MNGGAEAPLPRSSKNHIGPVDRLP